VSSAPVIVRLNYETAKLIIGPPRESDHGLVIVAVDSSTNGAGWVVYQQNGKEKHPVLFGSCTFSEVESRYSQPKCELYGIFRALKDLRHRIWGIHFRLDVDAKFLAEMIRSPDLPNAPMTRWVMYFTLFEFEINHVPAEKHQAADGLPCRKRSPLNSDEEDAEKYLDNFIGTVQVLNLKDSPLLSLASRYCLSLMQSVIQTSELCPSLMSAFRPIPQAPFGMYNLPKLMSTICNLDLDEDDDEHDDLIGRI
jgi:hypothetical protein